MGKEGRRKIMPVFITLLLILSMIIIFVPTINVIAQTGKVTPRAVGLTPGETIHFKVTDDGLEPEETYELWVWNATATKKIKKLETADADKNGDIDIELNVPGWNELGENPLNNSGTWVLGLHKQGYPVTPNATATITIDKYFDVRYKTGDTWIDFVIYNKTYTNPDFFYVYVYNWTGNRYELVDDEEIRYRLFSPDGGAPLYDINTSTGYWKAVWTFDYGDPTVPESLENWYYVNVSLKNEPPKRYSNATLSVLLDVTADVPQNAEWGDTINIDGYVRDGNGDGIEDYNVKLYCPINGGFYEMASVNTYSNGYYSFGATTGGDIYDFVEYASAGTWFVGTEVPGTYRINEAAGYEWAIATDFIRYHPFKVASDDNIKVELESPDEVVDGFAQTLNITAQWDNKNISWNPDLTVQEGGWVHITGLEAWNLSTDPAPQEYDDKDIITVGQFTMVDGKYSYLEFDITFNETGTATVIVTYPYNNENYTNNDNSNELYFEANMTGETTFQVGAAADINLVVSGMPDEVEDIIDTTPYWRNESGVKEVDVNIYGDTQADRINADLHVSGCGLDFTIDEDDDVGDIDELIDKDEGYYKILIAPKIGGTLTITATNSSEDLSVSKDFSISGLVGTVTTSIGDDKEISVENPENILADITAGDYARVRVGYYDEDWVVLDGELFDVTGDGTTAGEGLNGEFEFEIDDEILEDGVGFMVIVANAGTQWMYDVVEIAPVHDLEVRITKPENATEQILTVGLEHEDWEIKIYDPNGDIVTDVDTVVGKLTDEDHDEDNPLQTINFQEKSGNRWEPDDKLQPWFIGTLIITATNNSGENEHDGNVSLPVDYATITYSPIGATAGIDLENVTVEVSGVDANGNPLPEGTTLYLHVEEEGPGFELTAANRDVSLDEDGMGEFEIRKVGDNKTWINATLEDNDPEDGNMTDGQFDILFPDFTVEPDTAFIGEANLITITAQDMEGNFIQGINLTLISSLTGILAAQPDPVETDANGQVIMSIQPLASGKLNVTIARDLKYVNGQLNWTNAVITDTYVTVTSKKELRISVSKSPIKEDETLTITITSGGKPVSEVDVEFADSTKQTDANGEVTFTVPDPGVEFATYMITAEKTGYITEEKTITVLKKYEITIVGPSTAPTTGETFTVTIIAKGAPLAGAGISFNDKTFISDGEGKVQLTAPSKKGDYTVTASHEDYGTKTLTIKVTEAGIPGFELITLVIAVGVAFILLRRRRQA
jgi:hypothetical protein